MQLHIDCQSCRRPVAAGPLTYTRGERVLHNEDLLQCDVCERYACAACLQVYQIVSGYDFICHDCAQSFGSLPLGTGGH
jgi:LSD1 subclass zinc finger protein